jgi:FtsP/CotA-like multicopper oxidase with cupredoxin domain
MLGGLVSGCVALPTGARTMSGVERGASRDFVADVEIDLRSQVSSADILPGGSTAVWKYEAALLKGDASVLTRLEGSYLGPIIRVKKGQRVRIHYANELPTAQPSIVHWHGLRLPEDMDGGPRYAIAPGKKYVYEFQVNDRAGTYWFHPHPHGLTGLQVHNGLAGLFLVSDDEESALGLPSGDYDVPLVIQDRTFDAENQFVYLAKYLAKAEAGGMHGGHGMHGSSDSMAPQMAAEMQTMMGFLGERVLVNGKPDFVLSAATRSYRLRLLNGSNARIYKLGWSDGRPVTVIGSDGGLLEQPVEKPYVMLAPAERVELWVDFRGRTEGEEITLQSLRFEGADDHGRMPGMAAAETTAQGAPLTLFTVRIERSVDEPAQLPQTLSTIERLSPEQSSNAGSPHKVALTFRAMQWYINGRQYEMDEALPEETVKAGSTEIWEVINELNPGAMMDANGMAHPIHLHGVHFQVLGREVLPQLKAGWDTVRVGLIDEGWKDTVLVMPGERVRLAMTFGEHRGLFQYHCHNLEHESAGMMRNFCVV